MEFGDYFLLIFLCYFKNSVESVIDMVKLGLKLINVVFFFNLLDIDWKMLGLEVCFLCFYRVRILDIDDFFFFFVVYKFMYGERIISIDCLVNIV